MNTIVHIDGAKIKQIREEQGLTQLYVATVVGVTVDTISRWENKRYPGIKKENGLKLAEALEVDLEELTDKAVGEPVDQAAETADHGASGPEQSTRSDLTQRLKKSLPVLAMVLVLIIAGVGFRAFLSSEKPVVLRAERFMPAHTAPGLAFPVVVKVSSEGGLLQEPVLIRETTAGISRTWPVSPNGTQKSAHRPGNFGAKPRWIGRLKEGGAVFIYMALPRSDLEPGGVMKVTGDLVLKTRDGKSLKTVGATRVAIAPYHWADADRDYTISDNEILMVYETYTTSTSQLDLAPVEKIWLAGHYSWDGTALVLDAEKDE